MNRQHIIVTGGSRGLGAVLVEGLLEHGYRVSSCSRSKSASIEKLERDERYRDYFFWQPCEIAESYQVGRFVDSCVEWAGDDHVYGLVNNAGIAMAGILATFPNVETEKILRVNLLGTIQMTRAVCRHLLPLNQGGRIINISSIIGSRGFNGLSVYSASKAGLDGFSRALAREVGRRQITVNSVAPGYIQTDMSSTLNPGQLAQIANRTPLGRLGHGRDVLALVRFLLSAGAGFITGQTIFVDGGISA